MEISICRICLQSDEVDEEMRSIFEGNESNPTLQSKLNALGFLQAKEGDGLPSLLCGWCAARVDDAFDLKRQCERSGKNLKNMHDNVQKEEINAEDIGLAVLDLSFKTSNYFVEHSSSASSNTNNKNISSMLSCTRKMMTCLRNFSSALKKLGWVVNNSLRFTMEIISLFCTLLSRDDAIEFKKILHLEREADNWKTKSAMIEETVGLLHLLTSASETLTACPGVGVHEWSACSETSISSDSSGFMELGSDTSLSAQSFSSNDELNNNCKEKASEVSFVQQSDSQYKPLRRSKRSKKSNNHSLVCSQCPNDASGPSDLTIGTLLLDLSLEGSIHDVNAHNKSLVCPNNDSQEKGKRKQSHRGGTKLRKKKKKKKSRSSSGSATFPPTVLNSIYAENIQCAVASNKMETDCKSISPSISAPLEWEKETESNIPILNQLKTTPTTTLYPCSFCEKNFSTGWNRTQHERCHTGEKPYVCNICGESFRYNVTMRNHRDRMHNIKSEV